MLVLVLVLVVVVVLVLELSVVAVLVLVLVAAVAVVLALALVVVAVVESSPPNLVPLLSWLLRFSCLPKPGSSEGCRERGIVPELARRQFRGRLVVAKAWKGQLGNEAQVK